VIARALALGVLLMADARSAGGGPAPEPPCTPDRSFGWLLGHWTGEGRTAWELSWSEPNGLPRPRRPRATDPKFVLHLDVWAFRGRVDGQLGAERGESRLISIVTFTIKAAPPTGHCVLIWREGGAKYELRLESSSSFGRQVVKGDLEWVESQAQARFSLTHGPSHRAPFPISIELSKRVGFRERPPFELRRVEGPQHGAAIDQTYLFK
jgi:hypothetical protein